MTSKLRRSRKPLTTKNDRSLNTQDTTLVMHLINTRLGAVDERSKIKECATWTSTAGLSGSHTSSVGRTKVLSHAILATTNRGSKIILLLGFCTYTI